MIGNFYKRPDYCQQRRNSAREILAPYVDLHKEGKSNGLMFKSPDLYIGNWGEAHLRPKESTNIIIVDK